MTEYEDVDLLEEQEENPISEELQASVRLAIEDAADFTDSTLSPIRAESAEYYDGVALEEQEGRSTAQTMDVRDCVQAVLPSLIRIFCGSEKVVEYAPRGAEDIPLAKQATDYVSYLLQNDQDDSYISILYAVFKDALVKGSGFLKYSWKETERIETEDLDGLTDDALAALNSDEDVEITRLDTSVGANQDGMDDGMATHTMPDGTVMPGATHADSGYQDGESLHSVTLTRRIVDGRVTVAAVPPEEMLVSRGARNFNCDLIAHRKYCTVSELVEMGYDYEEMLSYVSDENLELTNEEARQRLYSGEDNHNFEDDDTRQRVLYVEAYMQIGDESGVSELRRICTAGPSYDILANNPADDVPFCHFCPDPEPHTFWGLSLADLLKDVQRIKSSVLRASLDSLSLSTHPRVAYVEGQASLEDLLSNQVGQVIRMRSPGAVQPFNIPYVGKEAFPMLQYMDEIRENRTGISKAAAGLSPDQLQSSTLAAVTQTISAAQQRIELIARLFAENGMKRLYKGLLRLITTYQDQERIIRLRNEFVPMSPQSWDASMDVVTNVAIGVGGNQERLALLGQISEIQERLMTQLGPDNPIVSAQNYYNTLVSTLELGGIKDTARYFTNPAEYQPPPEQPPEPDVNQQLIEVQMKEIESNIQKKMAELELEREKMIRDDDRLRDKNEADVVLKSAELEARYGAQIDTASIKAAADRDREMVKALAQQPQGPVNG